MTTTALGAHAPDAAAHVPPGATDPSPAGMWFVVLIGTHAFVERYVACSCQRIMEKRYRLFYVIFEGVSTHPTST